MPDLSFDRFKAIVADQLGVEAEQVTPEASFVEDLNADSLDLVELIMAFEEEYQMEISRRGRGEDRDGGAGLGLHPGEGRGRRPSHPAQPAPPGRQRWSRKTAPAPAKGPIAARPGRGRAPPRAAEAHRHPVPQAGVAPRGDDARLVEQRARRARRPGARQRASRVSRRRGPRAGGRRVSVPPLPHLRRGPAHPAPRGAGEYHLAGPARRAARARGNAADGHGARSRPALASCRRCSPTPSRR